MRAALLLASILAVGSSVPALAQTVAQRPYAQGDFSSFRGGPNALPDAIRAIESTNGGHVIDIRFRPDGGAAGFDAVVTRKDEVQFIHFGDTGGAVVLQQTSEPAWMLPWRGRMDVRLVKQAPVSLSAAVRTAEAAHPGASAIAAGIARSATNATSDVKAYNVLLLENGTVRRVAVDSATGEVIANPGALTEY